MCFQRAVQSPSSHLKAAFANGTGSDSDSYPLALVILF